MIHRFMVARRRTAPARRPDDTSTSAGAPGASPRAPARAREPSPLLACLLGAVWLAACSSTSSSTDTASVLPEAGPADAGPPDSEVGEVDADVADAGARPDAEALDLGPADGGLELCPASAAPGCTRASDCAPDQDPPTNCAACPSFNTSVCAAGLCSSPAILENGDVHLLHVYIPSSILQVRSFAGVVLDGQTSGGASLSCEDVYSGAVAFDDPCVNVLDVRIFPAIAQAGTTYTFAFSRFASGRRSLFVVSAYSDERSRGERVGISCTPFVVGLPGLGNVEIAGADMRHP